MSPDWVQLAEIFIHNKNCDKTCIKDFVAVVTITVCHLIAIFVFLCLFDHVLN